MRIILSDEIDVYFHLAAEDYFLHHTQEDIAMVWRSDKAIVCGKHQNIFKEANYAWCKIQDISLARRLSGGGTVYHDLGNINFTFIKTAERLENSIQFKSFLQPIIEVLSPLGIEAMFSGRNDLLVNGLKVSGNAEHVFQKGKRVLHHGTLLFDSDLDSLGRALKSTGNYIDKAVASVRSQVCNLAPLINKKWGILEFKEYLIQALADYFFCGMREMTQEEKLEIQRIKSEKFQTEEWILGYSPNFKVKKLMEPYTFEFVVERGVIKEAWIQENGLNPSIAQMRFFNGRIFNETVLRQGLLHYQLPESWAIFLL